MADNEPIDVVDLLDRPIHIVTRSEAHREDATHRGVHIFIFKDASHQEILVQQRSKTKSVSPLKWCHSASGHLLAGQTYLSGAIHELDELFHGKVVPIEVIRGLRKYCNFRMRDSETNNEFITLYTLVYEGQFELDPDEVQSIEYKPVTAVVAEIETDTDKYTRAFRQTFEVYLRLRDIYQANGITFE
jgi:isopentenyldiphosphate isomerase